ncbi:hypothetical protein KKF34_14860 [Myxococcota bacterium]|nr:hypothetical protein [Myxococcota bacterium]MBU1382260.1 hypothetical protein [Myxococcota bacterium]MBU1498156.1 hypothetical protein [Myxococcota bacterium]
MKSFLCLSLVLLFACKSEKTEVFRNDLDVISRMKKRKMLKCAKKTVWYIDNDGDGYGDDKKSQEACSQPDGYVATGGDCDDSDERVHPKQTEYFSIPRKDGSFDFDCDGKQTPRLTVRAYCEVHANKKGCNHSSGWDIKASQKIPDCGVPENWAWNECRTELLDEKATTDATAQAKTPSSPIVKPPSKAVHQCWSGKLQWKKRQLCR